MEEEAQRTEMDVFSGWSSVWTAPERTAQQRKKRRERGQLTAYSMYVRAPGALTDVVRMVVRLGPMMMMMVRCGMVVA